MTNKNSSSIYMSVYSGKKLNIGEPNFIICKLELVWTPNFRDKLTHSLKIEAIFYFFPINLSSTTPFSIISILGIIKSNKITN